MPPSKLPALCDPSLYFVQRVGAFADWKLPTDEELRRLAEDLRFDDIIFGLTRKSSGDTWVPSVSAAQVKERCIAARQAGLEPTIMPWGVRKMIAIGEMCNYALEATDKTMGILIDAEEDWYSGTVYPVEAADIVSERLNDRIWGVSGIGNLKKQLEPLVKRARFVVPQCYSFWKPGNAHWSHSKSTFPGPQQDQGFNKWSAVNVGAEMIMGGACYWGKRPANGTTPALSATHTMRFATIEAAALGIQSIWFWSLKWLLEVGNRGAEVRSFFGCKP